MSSKPPPPPPPPPSGDQSASRAGVAIGIVLTLVLLVGGALLGVYLGPGGVIGLPLAAIIIAWLLLRARVPGYGRGVVWGLGIAAVIFTGCTLLVIAALSGV